MHLSAALFVIPNCGLVPLRRRLTQLPLRIRATSAATARCAEAIEP